MLRYVMSSLRYVTLRYVSSVNPPLLILTLVLNKSHTVERYTHSVAVVIFLTLLNTVLDPHRVWKNQEPFIKM